MRPPLLLRKAACLVTILFLQVFCLSAQEYVKFIKDLKRDKNDVKVTMYRHANDSFELEQIDPYRLVKFPAADSDAVAKTLNESGLKGFKAINDSTTELVFKSEKRLEWGNRSLHFDDAFFKHASILAEHVSEKTRQLLIFVSDPHQYNWMIPYLRNAILDLIRQNPQYTYYFLDEGFYHGPGREVIIDSLKNSLSGNVPVSYQAHQLGKHYIIDLAAECQILLDHPLKEFAIDDTDAIKRTLILENKIGRIPLATLDIYADRVLDYYEDIFDPSASNKTSWTSSIVALTACRKAWRNRQDQLFLNYLDARIGATKCYAQRDTAMAKNINTYRQQYPGEIPLIFIGDAHLKGISYLLPDSVGYLLISAPARGRIHSPYSDSARRAFDSMRFVNSRSRTFNSIPDDGGLKMKLPPMPFPNEWVYVRRGVREFNRTFSKEISKGNEHFSREIREQVTAIVRSNGYLEDYDITFSSETIPAEAGDVNPFASIQGHEIIFYDDGNYIGNQARMDYLRHFDLPSDKASSGYIDQESGSSFNAVHSGAGSSDQWLLTDYGKKSIDLNPFRPDHKNRRTSDIFLQANICKN